jgi:hypothetical protein
MDLVDMQVIVRRQGQKLCASITCMIRHYVARRAKVTFDHPHNADVSEFRLRILMQRPASPFVISNTVRHVAERWYPSSG